MLVMLGAAMLIFTTLGGVMFMAKRKLGGNAGSAIRELGADLCDRFLAGMPESFPPNRMMANLDTVKEQNARIIELLEESRKAKKPTKKAKPRRTKPA
jgi:hypothetical protein